MRLSLLTSLLLSACVSTRDPVIARDPVSFTEGRAAEWSRILAEHRMSLEVPPDLSPAEREALLEDLVAGLHALPPGARRFPGEPITFTLQAADAPFGMGDGSGDRPEWDEEGARFFLYRYLEPVEPRALYRLERLSPSDRQRLWRRRAVVHAVISRWDDRLKWSRREAWTRVTGWRLAGSAWTAFRDEATNSYDWAYSRLRGMDSPQLDLITFAEEALVPATALREDATPVDDRIECQEFARWRFLDARLAGLEGRRPNEPADLEARPHCPAFDRWAALENLSHIELLLSAPSGQRPQSLFGHLMIRPVHDAEADIGFDRVTEIAAVTGLGHDGLTYVLKGAFGGFENAFSQSSLGAVRMEHVDQDQRTVRRFRLNLDPAEKVRVMERIWELERRGYFPYYFLSDNCGTYVAYLVAGALDERRKVSLTDLFVLPTGVLDALARVETTDENGSAVPLLVAASDDDLLSHRARALTAERRLAELLPSIQQVVPALGVEWRAVVSRVRDSDLRERRMAHGALGTLARRTLETSGTEATAALVSELVACVVLIERYAAQLAEEAMRQIDDARIQLPRGVHLPDDVQVLTSRRLRYQREDKADRVQETLRDFVQLTELLESAPRRAPTPEEVARYAYAREVRRNFIQLALSQGEVVDAVSRIAPEAATPTIASVAEQRFRPRRAASGLGRLAIGAGALRSADGGVSPAVLTRSAFLRERLGERRERGLDPLMELRVLDGEVLWIRSPSGLPTPAWARLTGLRLLSVPREPGVAQGRWYQRVGWGLGWEQTRDPSLPLPNTGHYYAQVLAPLAASAFYEQHVVLGVGPLLTVDTGLLPQAASAGPRAMLLTRLELPSRLANAARLEVTWTAPYAIWGVRPRGLRQVISAEAAVELEAGQGRGYLIEASARGEWEWGPTPRQAVHATLAVEWP